MFKIYEQFQFHSVVRFVLTQSAGIKLHSYQIYGWTSSSPNIKCILWCINQVVELKVNENDGK